MEKLKSLLREHADECLEHIVISRPRDKKNSVSKVRIRPVLLKGNLMFQETSYDGASVRHRNLDKDSLIDRILTLMERDYVQIELRGEGISATGLVNRKGELTLKVKRSPDKAVDRMVPKTSLSHDRKKRRILEEGRPVGFLIDLGLMTEDGRIVRSGYDKYRQINRFLEFIEDITYALPKDREVRILDFGCGKSYLTFAVYYYLKELKGYEIRITGLDLKEDVIKKCNDLRDKYGYGKLDFVCGDVADYFESDLAGCDLMLTLHACDTATDHALYYAIKRNAGVILSVPCCQHEVNQQIDSPMLAPIMKYGIIKERMSALITDGVRAELLRKCGYDVDLIEFIDMEHTPKNILIRAVRKERMEEPAPAGELELMLGEMNIKPALYRMLSKS